MNSGNKFHGKLKSWPKKKKRTWQRKQTKKWLQFAKLLYIWSYNVYHVLWSLNKIIFIITEMLSEWIIWFCFNCHFDNANKYSHSVSIEWCKHPHSFVFATLELTFPFDCSQDIFIWILCIHLILIVKTA